MKRFPLLLLLAAVAACLLAAVPARADSKLSPKNLDKLDQWGWLTPGFKAAVHELVETKQAILEAQKQEKEMAQQLPAVQKKAADAEAQVEALRRQLAEYDHGDENDFTQLQKMMNDAGATANEQRVLAQAYVWSYPASSYQMDARQYLRQAQKKLGDQLQAQKDAEAVRVAARAKMIQRAQARDLSLAEWRDFLRGMSQEDLLRYFGRPDYQGADYWVYSGAWTEDAVTHQKVGLQVTFNAARVISVAETAH